jgi:hypothetical protein
MDEGTRICHIPICEWEEQQNSDNVQTTHALEVRARIHESTIISCTATSPGGSWTYVFRSHATDATWVTWCTVCCHRRWENINPSQEGGTGIQRYICGGEVALRI